MANVYTIFESNKGIAFVKTIYKNGRCRLTIKHKADNYTLMTYRFKNTTGLESSYVSWDNLNCCGGWTYDETYLHTAVQNNRKLYAGIVMTYNENDQQAKLRADKHIEKLAQELPEDCIMGYEDPAEHRNGPYVFKHIYICRTGAIADHINIGDVLETYERLGIVIDADSKKAIIHYCNQLLQSFSGKNKAFDYASPYTGVEFIVTGLLLGYPLESTAWLLERDRCFPYNS